MINDIQRLSVQQSVVNGHIQNIQYHKNTLYFASYIISDVLATTN